MSSLLWRPQESVHLYSKVNKLWNCCLKFTSPCDNELIQLPLKSPWLSLALRKWPFKCDLFSNNDWSLAKTNLRFFPTQHEMENQFLGALSSSVTNWFLDPCGWERGEKNPHEEWQTPFGFPACFTGDTHHKCMLLLSLVLRGFTSANNRQE